MTIESDFADIARKLKEIQNPLSPDQEAKPVCRECERLALSVETRSARGMSSLFTIIFNKLRHRDKSKLWLIRPTELGDQVIRETDGGVAIGFVVCAVTEHQARHLADRGGGSEKQRRCGDDVMWLSQNLTTCVELKADCRYGTVMRDFDRRAPNHHPSALDGRRAGNEAYRTDKHMADYCNTEEWRRGFKRGWLTAALQDLNQGSVNVPQ